MACAALYFSEERNSDTAAMSLSDMPLAMPFMDSSGAAPLL
jgi:hypothetical protein